MVAGEGGLGRWSTIAASWEIEGPREIDVEGIEMGYAGRVHLRERR